MGTAAEDIVARKLATIQALDPTRAQQPYTAGIAATQADQTAQTGAASSEALRRGAGDAAAAAVRAIVDQGSTSRVAQMDRDSKLGVGYLYGLTNAHNAYFDDSVNDLGLIEQEVAKARSGGGGGGRGGGGGGGGGGSGSDFPDAYWVNEWETGGPAGSFYDLFGSESTGKGAAKRYVKETARDDFDRRSGPAWERRRAVASEYGMTPETQAGWFEKGPAAKKILPYLDTQMSKGMTRNQAMATAQAYARRTKGDQGPLVNMIARNLGVKERPKRAVKKAAKALKRKK